MIYATTMNERLRDTLRQRGISVERLAKHCGVDPKTARRWVTTARTPHRRHREAAAELLGVTEGLLWPSINDSSALRSGAFTSEVFTIYPEQASVPREVWLELFQTATTAVDILIFSGTFLQQTNPKVAETLLERASTGVRVRLCFGDPSGSAIQLRDAEEGIHGTLGAKIRASMSYFTKLVGDPNCGVRLHNTTLYASLFRFDGQMLVNPHIWGTPASANPVIHVRSIDSDCIFNKYLTSFDQIWQRSSCWQPDAAGQTQ